MNNQILIVDDDKLFRETLTLILSDYTVEEAANGREAINILSKPNGIDLVILDFQMPGMLGTEVLKLIKKDNPNLPVVMLTGFGTKEVIVESLKGHADYFLEKPPRIIELRSIVTKLLQLKMERDGIREDSIENNLDRVKYFIKRNYNKKVSLEDAAAAVCLSAKYLSRTFKERVGTGFCEYKIEIKIDNAKKMLEQTNYTVCRISEEIGYENTESFIRAFKKKTTLTPIEFRNQSGRKKSIKSRICQL